MDEVTKQSINIVEKSQKNFSSSKKVSSLVVSPINNKTDSDHFSRGSRMKQRRCSHEEQAFSPVAFKIKDKVFDQKKKIVDNKLNIFISFESELSNEVKREDSRFDGTKNTGKKSNSYANEISNQKFSAEYYSPVKGNSNIENEIIKFNSMRKGSAKSSNFFENLTNTEPKQIDHTNNTLSIGYNPRIPKHPSTQNDDVKKVSEDQGYNIPVNEFPTFRNMFVALESKKTLEQSKTDIEPIIDSQCETSVNKKHQYFHRNEISENESEDDYAILEENLLSENNLSKNDDNQTKSEMLNKLSDNFITACSNIMTEPNENQFSSLQLIDDSNQNYNTDNNKSKKSLSYNYRTNNNAPKNYLSCSKIQHTPTNTSLEHDLEREYNEMLNNFNKELIGTHTNEDISYNCSTTTLKKNDESYVKSQTNDSGFYKSNFHCENKFNMKNSNFTQNDRLEHSHDKISNTKSNKLGGKSISKKNCCNLKLGQSAYKSISQNSLNISDKSCMSLSDTKMKKTSKF